VRRRGLTLLVAGVFLLGTASACSDDDEGDENPTEEDGGSGSETDEGGEDEGGDESGSGGSEAVQDFCAEVDEFVEAAADGEVGDSAALTSESQELISSLDPTSDSYDDDMAAIQECVTAIATGAAS
jgi:hypothetical protein